MEQSRGLATVSPGARAADTDRNAVVDRLIAAHTEGRLDIHEFEARVSSALVAKTYGDLEDLTADLPTATSEALPGRRRPRWVRAASSWQGLGVATFGMVAIDFLNAPGNPLETPFAYPLSPWPLLVALPWAGVLTARAIRSRVQTVQPRALPTS